MVLVADEQLQRMQARPERDLGLGLAGAEVQVIEVVGNGLVERRQLGIDQQMVMARILALGPGRRNAHIAQAEGNLETCGNRRSILEIDEVDFRARTRWGGASGACRLRHRNARRRRC